LRRRARLLDEALRRRLLVLRLLLEHLHGDALVDDHVARRVHHAHPALAELRLDLVAAVDGGAEEAIVEGLGAAARPTRQRRAILWAELQRVRITDLARGAGYHGRTIVNRQGAGINRVPVDERAYCNDDSIVSSSAERAGTAAARSIAEQACWTKSMR